MNSFPRTGHKAGEKQELSLVTITDEGTVSKVFGYMTDFSVRPADVAVDQEMAIVFAGYGLSHEESGYDDFKGMDVKGKVILRLSGYPGHTDTTSTAYKAINPDGKLSGWRLNQTKNEKASELGAAAVIEMDQGTDYMKYWADNIPFRYNSRDYEGDTPRESYYETSLKLPGNEVGGEPTYLSVSGRLWNALLKDAGVDPAEFEKGVKDSMKPVSQEIKGKALKLRTTVDSRIIRARNVVGVIPGKDTSEIIVVGGHYDHLGKHDGWIWNGADDNASGTVGVMTIAKAFSAAGRQPEKTIVFAAWTGEEKGLWGSKYFAEHPYENARMILNLNYDMISRDNHDDTLGVKCSMTYTEKYAVLEETTRKNNEEYDLGLEIRYRPSERPRGGSDHTPFAEKDVPVIYFMAGFPLEYHQPGDHINLVNFDKMVNIIRIGYLNIWDLANTAWGPSEKKQAE